MVDNGQLDDFNIFSNILLLAFMISGMAYSIYANRLLNKHKLLLEKNFSNKEGITLNWLRSFIWGVGLIFISVIVNLFAENILGITYPFNPDYIHYSILIFAILVLGYYGIRHKNIFVDNVVVEVEEKMKAAYKKSGLKVDVAQQKYNELLDLMQQQKPYLKPKLTLTNLAKDLSISPNHLSQIINQFEGQNFNDFVNKYRVEEFIHKAFENKQFSFLALALESGFNSKSTFNAVFKKHKSLTPSQFMAHHQKQQT